MVINVIRAPHVPTSEELWNAVVGVYFSLQARNPSIEPGIDRLRRLELRRVRETRKYLIDTFRDIALGMPFLDSLHPFYRELIELMIDRTVYKHSLAKVGHATKALSSIYRDTILSIRSATTNYDIIRARKKFLSRVRDLIMDLKPELDFLKGAAVRLDKLPNIEPGLFTIVVSGMPNVGKSSFVRCVSSGRPRVAEYPFTTKELHVGHFTVLNDVKIQVIDTPGLLDRPLSERNKIELQAILALKYLAKVIVFILDPTSHSGYSLTEQINLLREIRSGFSTPTLVLINKIDIATENEVDAALSNITVIDGSIPIFKVSTINCSGCKVVIDHIVDNYVIPMLKESLSRQ
ncbi:small GTP-binding protein [Vulcanisaeta souniana JCM 11219]|uniref:Small GTP-binding protein n=1 Tax=Vulcanisaeta souniana JCM 11219 TaxID=1293586 RepID=A0A830E708_9CREN|nr:GTPase [Vulcanisaeta souniana]BDR91917.1 small GTP-binding protein [Vulcanisaeta souniana JCM 11219]GGI69382.1 small GTP-binding protein [Vulcanisaeta souniana JCM 11219]